MQKNALFFVFCFAYDRFCQFVAVPLQRQIKKSMSMQLEFNFQQSDVRATAAEFFNTMYSVLICMQILSYK